MPDAPRLRPRQRLFVALYVDEGLPTFGNASAAYAKAYSVTNRNTAKANGWRLLAKADVQAVIAQKLREAMVGMERRIDALANLLDAGTETRKEYDADGHLVRTIVTSAPAGPKLKAIDILNRLDNSYR